MMPPVADAGRTFDPDTFMVTDLVPSPNFDDRIGGPPYLILLHYTGMRTGEAALARLTSADSKVSSHYVVFEDGRVVQCVSEDKRAWHAGVSHWAGATDINSRSIGIEIVNPGHEFGYRPFPDEQIASLIPLVADIKGRVSNPARYCTVPAGFEMLDWSPALDQPAIDAAGAAQTGPFPRSWVAVQNVLGAAE